MELTLAPEVLLKETYNTIVSHPELHKQSRWYEHQEDCGTAYCFAGMAVHLAYPNAKFFMSDMVKLEDEFETVYYIPDLAEKILGLTSEQRHKLFAAGNTILDIQNYLEKWGML
jgi:hypothetical protein